MVLNLSYYIIINNWNMFRTPRQYQLELLNEGVIFFTVYFLIIFTNFFVTDAYSMQCAGMAMLSLTVLNFVINFLPILNDARISLMRKYRVWRHTRAINLKKKAVIYAVNK